MSLDAKGSIAASRKQAKLKNRMQRLASQAIASTEIFEEHFGRHAPLTKLKAHLKTLEEGSPEHKAALVEFEQLDKATRASFADADLKFQQWCRDEEDTALKVR